MAEIGIISLDQPRSVGKRRVALVAGASLVYLMIALAVRNQPDIIWPAIPVFATAHAFAVAIVAALTGLALWSYAVATRQRGYLWLAGSYCFLAALVFVFPLFFPNGLVISEPPTIIVGGPDSGPWIFLLWHVGFLSGLMVGSALLAHDAAAEKGPPPFHPLASALVLVASVIAGPLAVWGLQDQLPRLLEGQAPTPFFAVLLDGLLVLSVITAGVLIYFARHRTLISLWLVAVSVVAVGEAIMGSAGARYSMPWYYNRVSGLVAALILLMLLVGQLGRMGRVAERFAETDALTGLVSRRSFLTQMQSAMEAPGARRSGLVYTLVDLDEFKEVNDTLGHPIGDVLLEQVADRLRRSLPPNAVIGRLGGDEFGLLLPGIHGEAATEAVENALAQLRHPYDVADATATLAASAGLVHYPVDGQSLEGLIRNADLAMYTAKADGGNQARWFGPEMLSVAEESARLRSNLRKALDHREFSLDYQPVVSPVTGELHGVEALLRWQDGEVRRSAGEFIDEAERSGQIRAIGRQVLAMVENDLPRLRELMTPSAVHLNLSVAELGDQRIMDSLMYGDLAQSSGDIVLEVTESMALVPGTEAFMALERLRGAGYRMAVDDFGSGYGSIRRLQLLRPDYVKADKSILGGSKTPTSDWRAVMGALVQLSSALDSALIVEGVETEDQAREVAARGAPWVQGFYFARPMPLSGLEEWCRERRT